MINNVCNLLGEQLWVYCVTDHTATGNAVIKFHMAKIVPGERANSVAKFRAQRRERVAELPAASREGLVVLSMARIVNCDGDHLNVRKVFFRVS